MIWNRYSKHPVALVILPWPDGPGITIAKRDHNGDLYGCRDVTDGPHAAEIIAAWKSDAASQGLAIEDRTGDTK